MNFTTFAAIACRRFSENKKLVKKISTELKDIEEELIVESDGKEEEEQ